MPLRGESVSGRPPPPWGPGPRGGARLVRTGRCCDGVVTAKSGIRARGGGHGVGGAPGWRRTGQGSIGHAYVFDISSRIVPVLSPPWDRGMTLRGRQSARADSTGTTRGCSGHMRRNSLAAHRPAGCAKGGTLGMPGGLHRVDVHGERAARRAADALASFTVLLREKEADLGLVRGRDAVAVLGLDAAHLGHGEFLRVGGVRCGARPPPRPTFSKTRSACLGGMNGGGAKTAPPGG